MSAADVGVVSCLFFMSLICIALSTLSRRINSLQRRIDVIDRCIQTLEHRTVHLAIRSTNNGQD